MKSAESVKPVVAADTWFWSLSSHLYDLMWEGPASADLAGLVAAAGRDDLRFLDLGCGTGLVSWAATGEGKYVVGADSSPAMLRRALAKGRIARGITIEGVKREIPDGWADVVVLTNVLHVVGHPAQLLELASAKLGSGGVLVVSWPRDGLTPWAMLRQDIRQRRGLAVSLAAHAARLGVGMLGVFTTAGRRRRGGTAGVRAMVREVDGLAVVEHRLLAECQEVHVLRKV